MLLKQHPSLLSHDWFTFYPLFPSVLVISTSFVSILVPYSHLPYFLFKFQNKCVIKICVTTIELTMNNSIANIVCHCWVLFNSFCMSICIHCMTPNAQTKLFASSLQGKKMWLKMLYEDCQKYNSRSKKQNNQSKAYRRHIWKSVKIWPYIDVNKLVHVIYAFLFQQIISFCSLYNCRQNSIHLMNTILIFFFLLFIPIQDYQFLIVSMFIYKHG